MNKTEAELIELGKKVAHNYRLIISITACAYGCFVFYQTQKDNTKDIEGLSGRVSALEIKVADNEKNFNLITTKLDVGLAKISSDIQFIKEHLIRKGLDK